MMLPLRDSRATKGRPYIAILRAKNHLGNEVVF